MVRMRKYLLYGLSLWLISSSIYGIKRTHDHNIINRNDNVKKKKILSSPLGNSSDKVKPNFSTNILSYSFQITQHIPKAVQELTASFHDPVTLTGTFMQVAKKVVAIDKKQKHLAPALKSPLKLKFTGNGDSIDSSKDFQNALIYIIKNGSEEMRRRIVDIHAVSQNLTIFPTELFSFTTLSNRPVTTFLNLKRLNLSKNNLTGKLPPEMEDLKNLRDLYLYDNNLTKELPKKLERLLTRHGEKPKQTIKIDVFENPLELFRKLEFPRPNYTETPPHYLPM